MARRLEPSESNWALLREAQTKTLALPDTGMATAIDIGETNDIHPRNKKDVGKRLALQALYKVYDRDIICSGPVYKSNKLVNNTIVIRFESTGKGLITSDGETPKGFAIAGEDKKFHWAEVSIDDDTVIVSSTRVEKPCAVRYAWADNPECNLCNDKGLPALPFRTDSW
jgi:sialate O-acetylesterase